MKLKNFYNKISKKNKIYYAEEIGRMNSDEFRAHEPAINYQLNNLGIPREKDLLNSAEVYQMRAQNSKGKGFNTYYTVDYDENIPTKLINANVSYKEKLNKHGMTNLEEFQDKLYTDLSGILPNSIGHANLANARHDFECAKKDKNAFIVNKRTDLGSTELNNWMDKVGIPKNSRGVIYNHISNASTKLANSRTINDYIKKNEEKLRNGNIETDLIDFKLNKDLDAFLGIKHATLYKPHIDKDGYFNAYVNDYYDFDYRKRNLNPANILNNWGAGMQDKKKLENYFNIYYIHKKLNDR